MRSCELKFFTSEAVHRYQEMKAPLVCYVPYSANPDDSTVIYFIYQNEFKYQKHLKILCLTN